MVDLDHRGPSNRALARLSTLPQSSSSNREPPHVSLVERGTRGHPRIRIRLIHLLVFAFGGAAALRWAPGVACGGGGVACGQRVVVGGWRRERGGEVARIRRRSISDGAHTLCCSSSRACLIRARRCRRLPGYRAGVCAADSAVGLCVRQSASWHRIAQNLFCAVAVYLLVIQKPPRRRVAPWLLCTMAPGGPMVRCDAKRQPPLVVSSRKPHPPPGRPSSPREVGSWSRSAVFEPAASFPVGRAATQRTRALVGSLPRRTALREARDAPSTAAVRLSIHETCSFMNVFTQ